MEAYHKQEGWLIEKFIQAEGGQATESLVKKRRGELRNESEVNPRPEMSANQAKKSTRNTLVETKQGKSYAG